MQSGSNVEIDAQSKDLLESEKDARRTIVDFLPEWARNPAVMKFGTNVLLAMAMTKLFVPFKLALTAAVTPSVAKSLRSLGFTLGKPGGFRDAVNRIDPKNK